MLTELQVQQVVEEASRPLLESIRQSQKMLKTHQQHDNIRLYNTTVVKTPSCPIYLFESSTTDESVTFPATTEELFRMNAAECTALENNLGIGGYARKCTVQEQRVGIAAVLGIPKVVWEQARKEREEKGEKGEGKV